MKVLYLAGDLMEDFVVGSTLLWALGKLTQKIKVLDLLLFSFGLKYQSLNGAILQGNLPNESRLRHPFEEVNV